ncbi:hypothetical protein [Desulfonatronum lacustre]|uniref:hypothetical protein n=1 Tax=Desulfonatronum lacustre TaxID=66849 RepID=UPI00048F3406|nr:hypothetical protein [Desulfonatronum lacustre]
MALREKILVGLMLAAVLYGGYVFLDSRRTSAPAPMVQEASPADAVAQSALDIASRSRLDSLEWYILETALDSRGRNPFQRLEDVVLEQEPAPQRGEESFPEFIYQGFVNIAGQDLFVVINGREYQTGDQLDKLGYYLAETHEDAVVIQRRTPSGAVTGTLVVDLEGASW